MAEQGIESGAARRRQTANVTGVRKAAILLVAVGEELAKEVLRALPEPDVQRITEELADLRGVTPEISAEVLEEFWQLLDTHHFMRSRRPGLCAAGCWSTPSARSAPTIC